MHRSLWLVGVLWVGVGCGPLAERSGHLAVSPELVHLRAAVEGNPLSVPLALMNLGEAPLRVLRMRLGVSTGYSVLGPTLPLTLGPGDEAPLELQYRAGAGAPLSNVLDVECDGEPGMVRVELNAQPAAAVLSLVPPAVDFGAISSATTEERLVAVQNLGLGAAESLRLEWLTPHPDLTARLSVGRLGAGEIGELRLGYSPRGGDADHGLLLLRWNEGERLLRIDGQQDLRPPD